MNKSDKTKKTIFEEEKKLFWNYGYSNVTVRQIAKAAKIDVALIPRYYGNKLGLFTTILEEAFNWVEDLDVNDNNIVDLFTGFLLDSMDLKDETTIVKMLIMNAADPVVGDLVKNTNQKKMRTPILKKLKKITPLQYDLMASAVIGISQTRKTLRAPALTSLKREEYKRVLKYILSEPKKFKG